MTILNNGNFKKYAVKMPTNIKQIYQIDNWARSLTMEKLKIMNKIFITSILLVFLFTNSFAEVIQKVLMLKVITEYP